MTNTVKRGRGRPFLPRDEHGNIIRHTPKPETIPAQPAPATSAVQTSNVWFYNSVAAFIAAADEPAINPENESERIDQRAQTKSDWYGLASDGGFDDVCRIVNNGWTDGASRMQTIANDLTMPEIKSSRRRVRWSGEGDDIDMQRVYAGQIDQAWRQSRRVSMRQPGHYRIVIDVAHLSNISASDMFWPGAAGIVLADCLAQAGHNVEIIAGRRGSNVLSEGEEIQSAIVVKGYHDPLNIVSLAGVTALAGFFRSIGLTWTAGHFRKRARRGAGLSRTMRLTEAHLSLIPGSGADKTYLVSPNDITSNATARQWLETNLAEFQ